MQRGHILPLDGLRGIAASLVVAEHAALYLGIKDLIPGAHLAVDMFFCLSGYVLARAYDVRLADGSLSTGRFTLLRIVRLYPLLVAGIGIAAAFKARKLLVSDNPGGDTWLVLATGIFFSIILLPNVFNSASPFPLDTPIWSLSNEIWTNIGYAAFRRWLSNAVVWAIMAIAAAALIYGGVTIGTLNRGVIWDDYWLGWPRVLFSFSAGVMIYRLRDDLVPRGLRGVHPAWLLGLMGLYPFVPHAILHPIAGDLLFALFVSPVIVALGAFATMPARWAFAMAFLGGASYPVYVLHWPFALRLQDVNAGSYAVPVAVAFTIAFLVAGYLVDRSLDEPFRRALASWLGLAKRKKVTSALAAT